MPVSGRRPVVRDATVLFRVPGVLKAALVEAAEADKRHSDLADGKHRIRLA